MQDQNRLTLELRGVHYCKQQVSLLNNISFSLSASTGITVILGHNGAGKSLLLKICHGLIIPTQGSVSWNGQAPTVNQYWRAFILQHPTFLNTSVKQNLHFIMKVGKVPKPERTQRCEHALEVCGLSHLTQRNSKVLSGGEQQRLSIARALVINAQVILLDEPTAALDPGASIAIENLITKLRAEGTQIMMSTHNIPQARRLADEVLFMQQGSLLQQKEAASFFAEDNHEDIVNFLQ